MSSPLSANFVWKQTDDLQWMGQGAGKHSQKEQESDHNVDMEVKHLGA
jgi:hypothetical protein